MPLQQPLATFLSMVEVNSSNITFDSRLSAISALNPSPTDSTFLGRHHTGIELSPTADNLCVASFGVLKLEIIAFELSYSL